MINLGLFSIWFVSWEEIYSKGAKLAVALLWSFCDLAVALLWPCYKTPFEVSLLWLLINLCIFSNCTKIYNGTLELLQKLYENDTQSLHFLSMPKKFTDVWTKPGFSFSTNFRGIKFLQPAIWKQPRKIYEMCFEFVFLVILHWLHNS